MAGAGANLMTLKGWLQQEFPVLGVSAFDGTPSARSRFRQSLYLMRWVELSDSVRAYLEECDDRTRRLQPLSANSVARSFLTLNESDDRSALASFNALLMYFQEALAQSFYLRQEERVPISVESIGADGLAALMASPSGLYADLVVKVNGKSVLVIEMKRPALFRRTVSSEIPTLCDLGDLVGGRGSDEPQAGDPVRLEAIRQLYAYMVGLNLVYGILSSFDLTYVAYRAGEFGDKLYISDGIPRTDPNFLATIAYILHKSLNELAVKRVRKVNALATAPGSSTTPSSRDGKKGKRQAKRQAVGTDLSKRMRTRSGVRVALSETPAKLLHLAQSPFAIGWSENIVRGTYQGQSVVVKLAPIGSDRGEALLTEIEAYHMLKEVWGKYVPQLVSYGTSVGGSIVYIATEEIMGHEIGMGPLSQAVVEEIFDALAAVHQCGILHGDIRPSNILVTNGERAGVRFLDFGFACFVISDVGCKRECTQLESLLSELGCDLLVSVSKGKRSRKMFSLEKCS